jgi:hypothetical protein
MPAPAACSFTIPTTCSADDLLVRIRPSSERSAVEDSNDEWIHFRGSRYDAH